MTTWYEANVNDENNLKWAWVNVTNTYSPMRVYDNEETSLYEHSNERIEFNTLNANDEMRNHLMWYAVVTLKTSFNDVWVKCNQTFY